MLPARALLLLVDTCGASGSIALAAADPAAPALLGQVTLPGRSASERLLPTVRALLAENSATLQQLAAIAIVTGPGSFTGVRVGISVAKGLAEALGLPILALSRLAVLASRSFTPEVLALLDAGRGEFYAGLYITGQPPAERLLTRDAVLSLAAMHPVASVLACEPAVAAALDPHSATLLPDLTAADILPLALAALARADFANPVTLDANYLRRSDAELFARPPRPASSTPA